MFVSQSGLRGRLLRGMGWPVSVIGAMLAAAMITNLVGMQSDAPTLEIPSQHTILPVPTPASPSPAHSPAPGTTGPTRHP